MMRVLGLALLLAAILGNSLIFAAAGADAENEAAATFKSLYADEIARTKRTPAISDDIKLAGKLLVAAGASRSQPALLKLICDSAYDLGKRSSAGYDVALEAMHVLSANSPASKPQCLDRIVGIHQLQYMRSKGPDRTAAAGVLLEAMMASADANAQAGNLAAAKMQCLKASRLALTARLPQKDAIQDKYKALIAMERTEKLIVGHEKRLKLDPSNIASREALISIHLIEKNDPAAAAKYLNEDCDERLRAFIPMAAGDIDAIPDATLMEMGDWYKSMSAEAQVAHKGGLLLRAQSFYEAFIAKHTTADISRTKAVLALARVKADIRKYGVKAPIKIQGPVAAAAFTGVSRKASVSNPTKIPGVKAWTVELRDYLGCLYDVEFSKDGGQIMTAGQDGAIRFWDVATGKQMRVLMGHDGEVRALAWSKDRKTLASGSSDKTIRLWDVTTGKITATLRGDEATGNLVWSPDSTRLASSGRASSVSIWSVSGGKLIGKLKATDGVRAIDWSSTGVLATGADDGNVTLWNVRSGKPYGHFPLAQYRYKGKIRSHRVYALAYSPVNSRLMAVGFSGGTIKMWRPRTKIFPQIMTPEHKDSRGRNRIGSPSCIKWSSNARMLAVSDSGDSGGAVWFWNAAGKKVHRIDDHAGSSVYNLAWSPDGKHVATASSDSTSCIIDADAGEVLRRVKSARSHGAARPAYSADGTKMAYSLRDRTIRLWDLVKCKQISIISMPKESSKYVTRMLWSPDGTKIAFLAYSSGTAHILDVKSGVISSSLPAGRVYLHGLAWSLDSKKLYLSQSSPVRGKPGFIKLWDVASTAAEATLTDKKVSTPYGLVMSPDGKTLASSTSYGKVNLWSLAESKLIRTIGADERRVRGIAFSPDSKKLATCGDEDVVKVWSVATGEPIYGLKKSTDGRRGSSVLRVAFSPDGTRLASVDERYKINVWDMSDGSNVTEFGGSNWHLHWLKDSKTLAVAGGSAVSFHDAANGARKAVYYHMPKNKGLIIAANGHYSGAEGVEPNLIYQAVTASGQTTLSAEEFNMRFGWRNDPTKVKLIEDVTPTTMPAK